MATNTGADGTNTNKITKIRAEVDQTPVLRRILWAMKATIHIWHMIVRFISLFQVMAREVVCSLATLLFSDTVMDHEVFLNAYREQPQAAFLTCVLYQTISDLMQLQLADGVETLVA